MDDFEGTPILGNLHIYIYIDIHTIVHTFTINPRVCLGELGQLSNYDVGHRKCNSNRDVQKLGKKPKMHFHKMDSDTEIMKRCCLKIWNCKNPNSVVNLLNPPV